MSDTERPESAPRETEEQALPIELGPPGWEEFAGARARFMRTLAMQALEGAWAAPSREPRALD